MKLSYVGIDFATTIAPPSMVEGIAGQYRTK
jgi:hypothetical protein